MAHDMIDDHFPPDPDDDDTLLDDDIDRAIAGFFFFVRLTPEDAALARHALEAIMYSLNDASGPDAPTLGMMGVPVLIEDGVARAALADAAPSAREALGDLERALIRLPRDEIGTVAARIRDAIQFANARIAEEIARGEDGATEIR
jgi:hypothetical protein